MIEPHLPKNQPGARRVDDRRVISGILNVLKVGCRWCDCPADYRPSTTLYNRFNRWLYRGFWLKLLDAPVDADALTRSAAIDSTHLEAQRADLFGPVTAYISQRAGQDEAVEEELQAGESNARFHLTVPWVEHALADLGRSLAKPVAVMSG